MSTEKRVIAFVLAPGETKEQMTMYDHWLILQAKFWAWLLGWKVEVIEAGE